jgi:GNAT superfamily N-acetyltransferase
MGVKAAIELRAGAAGDLDGVVAVSLACARSQVHWARGDWIPPEIVTERQVWWDRLRDERTWVGVALAGFTRVGCICAWPASRRGGGGPRLAYLAGPLVDPDWWREGIGRALLEDALGVLRGRGFARVEIALQSGNRHGRRFLEHHGWELGETTRRPSSMAIVVYGRALSGNRPATRAAA